MLFLFFSILGEWGGWVLESMENSILFFFLNPSLTVKFTTFFLSKLTHSINFGRYIYVKKKVVNNPRTIIDNII